jgi:glycosyltransferase involved in cell wall biosynthesis
VPPQAAVVLFVAEPITRTEKGFAVLADALHGPDQLKFFLLAVGSGTLPVDVRVPHRHVGHVGDARIVSLYYSAADVFVMPTLHEAFGQTALEATACGNPVVGFATGGIPDIVRQASPGRWCRRTTSRRCARRFDRC